MLGVFWGTGVGGGLVLERPVVGRGRGASAEIGHVVVQNGRLGSCPCGRRGCLEAYAGRGAMEAARAGRVLDHGTKTALFDIMERRGKDRLASSVWEEALAEGDHLAVKLIDEAMAALGAGVASANNLLDVEGDHLRRWPRDAARPTVRRPPRGERCSRTCSSRTVPRPCWSPSSATSAAPSAPRSARKHTQTRPSPALKRLTSAAPTIPEIPHPTSAAPQPASPGAAPAAAGGIRY